MIMTTGVGMVGPKNKSVGLIDEQDIALVIATYGGFPPEVLVLAKGRLGWSTMSHFAIVSWSGVADD
jgi:hypothetical protein